MESMDEPKPETAVTIETEINRTNRLAHKLDDFIFGEISAKESGGLTPQSANSFQRMLNQLSSANDLLDKVYQELKPIK